MNDVLEELLEAVEEELDQGVSLVVSSSGLPRGGAVLAGGSTYEAEGQVGAIPSLEMEDETRATSEYWAGEEGVSSLVGGGDSALERGRRVTQMMGGEERSPSFVQQVAQLERRASLALQYSQGGGGGDVSHGVEGEGGSATSFSMASATRRQSVATVDTARTVDRAIARDARRYDGGFLLG